MNEAELAVKKTRILWIDYAKLIGIYFVILGHLNLNSVSANVIINSFHMQLFFFLSGVCTKKESVISVLKKSARGLLIPYVSFQILCYPYWFAKSYFQKHIELNFINYVFKPFFGFLYGVVFDTKYSYMVVGACWFLLALFFIRLISSLIIRLPDYLQLISCFILVLIAMFLKHFSIMLPFSINISFLCVPIFLMGFYAKDWINDFMQKVSLKFKLVIVVILSFALFTLANMNGIFHVGDGAWGKSIYLYYINAILGGGGIVFFAGLIKKENRFLQFLSRNTIIIMIFELYVYAPFKVVIQKIMQVPVGQQDYMPLWLASLVSLVSLVLCAIPCFIINKWFPFLIGKKKVVKS